MCVYTYVCVCLCVCVCVSYDKVLDTVVTLRNETRVSARRCGRCKQRKQNWPCQPTDRFITNPSLPPPPPPPRTPHPPTTTTTTPDPPPTPLTPLPRLIEMNDWSTTLRQKGASCRVFLLHLQPVADVGGRWRRVLRVRRGSGSEREGGGTPRALRDRTV